MQRLVAKSFGFLCLCLLAAALLAGVLVQTGPVKRRLVAHFLDQIQEATGHEVSVKHVRIILPFQLHAEGVRIRVEGADWLEVDKMSATWQPMKLYWNTVSIRDLRLDGVHLLRIPSPRESVTELAGETEEGKGQIGRQLDFEIQAFQLNRCNLKALPGATDLALVDLRGQLQWFPSENRTDLRIQATDSFLFSGSSRIRIQGQLEKEIYVLQAHLSESAAGPLSTALHLPGYPSADARMRIQGTAEDWGHCLGDFDLGGAHALTGNFEIKSYGFFAAMPQLETFFGQDLGTRGTFAYFSDGSLHVDRLQGSNSKIDYMGWLRFQDGFTLREADADIRFIDLAPFEDYLGLQLAGIVEGRLRYRGMPQARELSLQIASEHLKLEGFDVTDLSSTFVTKSPVDQNLQGLFLLDFRFEGVPVFFSTDLQQRDAKQWTCSGVELDLGPTALAGELEVDLTGPGISGRLNGKNQDLFGWSDYAKRRLEGRIDLDLILAPEQTTEGPMQGARIELFGSNVATRDLKAPELKISCALQDLLHHPHGTIALQSKDIKGSGWYIDAIDAKLGHEPNGLWTYDLTTRGRRYDPFQLSTTGEVQLIPNQLQIAIQTCDGGIHGHRFHLHDRTELTLNRLRIELTPLLMDIDDGVIRASIEDLVGGMEASISLRDIPLDILNVLRPTTPVSGTLTGQARLQGSRDSPIGDCLIQLHNFRLIEPGFQQVNPVNAQLSLSLADQRTAVQMEITGLDSKPVDIHGNLPIGLALDPLRLIVNPRNDHINLSVDAHGELGGFMQLFVPDSNRITGRFDIALNLLGTWDRPNIKGSIDLSKGIYHSLHTGSSFTNIEAHLVGRGQEIELESLSASDGAHGNLSATGKLSLARSEHYAFALTTHIHNCILVNMPAVNAIFDGRVTLEGDTLSGMLSGKLDVHHADLSIPEEINEAVPKLDVVYINQPAYEPQPTLLAPVADYWVLNLDLNVRARGQTFLRGRGLMSEWEGEGRVRGNTGEPLLYGKLSLVRGEYNFIGRIFTLTFGELLFNGPLRKNTSLNVSAELAMDGLTAQATLAGQLSEPQLALRSNPSRPLKEILSRILFEKEVHDITPLQGLELAQALLSMTNKKGGPDFVGTIRRNIGLDRLDISHNSNDPNEISVHAGKYIARGVFVSVNKSVNSVNNDISLEMRLSDQVKLEGQVGDKIGSKVSLKWKMDY